MEILLSLFESLKQFISENDTLVLIGAVTLIEISPLKINPWDLLFKWIGNIIFGDIRKEISDMKEQLTELKSDFEDNKAKEKRWHILDFVNSCRNDEKHTREEWNHVISELADYEVYCKLKHITNGVIKEDAKYLRQLFYERNRKNDFL